MNQKRSYKKLIIGVSAAVVIIAGVTFYMFDGVEKVRAAFQPKAQEAITVTGKLLCLPPKDGSETSTLSCALGMQADDGTYYGLSGSANTELSDAAGSEKKVKIEGKLRTSSDATYKMKAIIAVSSFNFTN